MKLIFLGTPDFAVKPLESIINSRHKVLAVVTQPDKPVGRKAVLTPSCVKVCAQNHGIKVLQYEKIKKQGVADLKNLNPDIMVTCAFGQILSREIIDIPKFGIINIHASLLPEYRGAAPIQNCILNGDKETGITIMQTEDGIDTGDILSFKKIAVGENETAGELSERLSIVGAELITETLDNIECGKITPIKQDESRATVVKTINKEDALIDWRLNSSAVKRLVLAMNPWPIAFSTLNGKRIKIFECESVNGDYGEAGSVVEICKDGFIVACGSGALLIKELQPEGGKRMKAYDFLLGRKIAVGDKFI